MQREFMEKSEQSHGRKAAGTEYVHIDSTQENERHRLERIRRLQEIDNQRLQARNETFRSELKRKRKNARQYTFWQIAGVAAAAVLVFLLTNYYIAENSKLIQGNQETVRLKAAYEALKSENDSIEVEIANQIDTDEVYRIAVEELGMVYPQKQQIVIYHKTESGYVVQNEAIPQEE